MSSIDESRMDLEDGRVLSDQERFDWLRLLRCDNIGPKTFAFLLNRHGSAAAAIEALPSLVANAKAGRPIRLATVEETEQEAEAMEKAGARFIALPEPDYPALQRLTPFAPPLIAVRGKIESLKRSKVAIVGARNASAAGLAFSAEIARGIARAGYVIVSGLARGIDARAHQATIETGTICVLAGGLGNVYPVEHAALLERILEQGAAISEMPFGWEARGRDFPRRNRIVAGLCRAVIVVEAARRSGSLITARFAADAGREIFAVPGSPLDPRAEGTNDLLREGATICTRSEDVTHALAELNMSHLKPGGFAEIISGTEPLWDELEFGVEEHLPRIENSQEQRPARILFNSMPLPMTAERSNNIERHLIELLSSTPIAIDELARLAAIPTREIRTVLLDLKLAGKIDWHSGDLVTARPQTLPQMGSGDD
ncbi:MAG: DNA-processing protein DprA [Alphaproteobacteria bacterium]|nr:DNA-processing protein DprA [Alphaproteobacteria bacterium]